MGSHKCANEKTWQFLTKEKGKLNKKGGVVENTGWFLCQHCLFGHNKVNADFRYNKKC